MPRGPTGTQPRGLLRAVAAVLALLVGSALGVPLLAAPATAAAPAPAQGSQWYHAVLGLAQAQRISQGAGVVVAVIDGGVDADHPKLRGQVLPGAGVGPEAAPDGRRDDDPDGHGTAMAGLIAGRNDNGPPEVRGIPLAARILPISTGTEADSTEVARGIHPAVDLGADIINLSLGSLGTATPDEREAVAYAFAHDVVVVASAGNAETGDRRPTTGEINSPANIPGVVAVTGSTARGGFWRGSSLGARAVIAAPAPGIRAPVPTRVSPDGLDTGAGTSNSAAIVSGVVALIRSARPDLDAPNVINQLIATARDAGPPGRDIEFGFGIVDPGAALTRPVSVVATNPLLATPTRSGGSGGGGGLGSPAAASAGPPTGTDGRAAPADGAASPLGAAADASADPGGPAAADGGPGQGRDGTAATAAGGAPGHGSPGHRGVARVTLAWVGGLALAVWSGGLIGVGAHLLSTRRTTTGRRSHGHS
ncbi:peptidase S8 [Candidatus Frankia alpina]|uniref:Peptidase S8 n=1 Tax=Candidatus Frankia alpina TaxID=2699483 RepID=A0A4S5E027_9ACTN|nr:peptidase S8 [Candidatus Frankia alpina]